MMKKEMWYAVIGGMVGALVTMLLCGGVQLGAQPEAAVAEFGVVTCRELKVVNSEGETVVLLIGGENVGYDDYSGYVQVGGKTLKGWVTLGNDDHGGWVIVQDKDGRGGVGLGNDKHGGLVNVLDEDLKGGVELKNTEYGGRVDVLNKRGKHSAAMSVNEYGDGAVSTWDKNGHRQK